MKWTKRPVTIDALQWDGSIQSGEAISAEFGQQVQLHAEANDPRPPRLTVATLEGVMYASVGDYIIRGIKGECYPCKPDVFAASYVKAEVQVGG